jgi:hypothetical protein
MFQIGKVFSLAINKYFRLKCWVGIFCDQLCEFHMHISKRIIANRSIANELLELLDVRLALSLEHGGSWVRI